MKIEEIEHHDLKNYINAIYLHGENKNKEAIEKTEEQIKEYLNSHEFIISIENKKPIKIPYGLIEDEKYVVPIYTDLKEYEKGLEYYSLNEMDENKDYEIKKLCEYKKINEDPNFLGYLINMASVSYITLL
mgnify:FL=1